MSNIDKQALRKLAVDAKELAIIKRYTKGIEAQKKFIAEMTPSTVLALLDELEAAEKRVADLEAKKVEIKLPESFYPDGDIECPLVINEYQIIEAIVAADCKPIAVCPRCKCELDLSHKHDGAHYCHAAGTGKGE
ncbi:MULTISPECIES: ead/Ea22-like family protein [unclassified Enterobacter cloacae complex]|uniref:ead/Ea22-like family protein n=1 Tax=unclassified Enterobacter cloacae complex TaxID=2757714 RepID=UPI001876341A|nr:MULTISPECIES: ead/Ea22-like family protein [unclassified Enterobacter cloacae complex]MBE4944696.1 ead/Ea22-like family protein [Enterobacter cloacae complex sp. P1B]MBE4970552.1 ead/Ea22-like family protein [Enterobacter cloacae complex sp. P11RS]